MFYKSLDLSLLVSNPLDREFWTSCPRCSMLLRPTLHAGNKSGNKSLYQYRYPCLKFLLSISFIFYYFILIFSHFYFLFLLSFSFFIKNFFIILIFCLNFFIIFIFCFNFIIFIFQFPKISKAWWKKQKLFKII